MTDLSLVPVDVLIDELDKRFCHFVFSGCQVLSGKEGSKEDSKIFTMRKWNGNSATCIGLCGMLQVVITDAHLQSNKLDSAEDEI